jgi:hypothetical protein
LSFPAQILARMVFARQGPRPPAQMPCRYFARISRGVTP